MTYQGEWEPGFSYGHGDIVTYEGKNYKIIQPHRSQSDWAPSMVPALWERTREGEQQQQHCPPPQQPQQPSGGGYGYGQAPIQQGNQGQGYGYGNSGGSDVKVDSQPQGEDQKKWYEDKSTLIGGGLALGLAAIGGGIYAHHKKKEDEEERQEAAAELQGWAAAAQRRTEAFLQQGPQGPVTWVYSGALDSNRGLLNDLITGGDEGGQPWYIARSPHEGGLQLGKARPGFGAYIGFKHDAILVRQYEVLIGNRNGVRWVRTSGKLDVSSLGARPVEGGHEDNGSPLYIARGRTKKGNLYPGKASSVLKGAYVTEGDDEVNVSEYEVLCYN